MLKLEENIECYSRPSQRDVLIRIIDNETIKNNFFLAGGTALSVFYLHHRTSIDLDLFTIKKVPLDEIYLWITRTWPKRYGVSLEKLKNSYTSRGIIIFHQAFDE